MAIVLFMGNKYEHFAYLAMLVYGTELTPFTSMVLIPHGFGRQNNLFLLSQTSKNKL